MRHIEAFSTKKRKSGKSISGKKEVRQVTEQASCLFLANHIPSSKKNFLNSDVFFLYSAKMQFNSADSFFSNNRPAEKESPLRRKAFREKGGLSIFLRSSPPGDREQAVIQNEDSPILALRLCHFQLARARMHAQFYKRYAPSPPFCLPDRGLMRIRIHSP